MKAGAGAGAGRGWVGAGGGGGSGGKSVVKAVIRLFVRETWS